MRLRTRRLSLKSRLPSLAEVFEDHGGNTYRAVYTVRFRETVYVLQAFQKKSPKGIKTAQSDVDLVERRLKVARQDYEARHGKTK